VWANLGVQNAIDHDRARWGRKEHDVAVKNTAAYRGISLSLVIGFLAPLCIVITPETPAVPNASAAAGDHINIDGAMPDAPVGATITGADVTAVQAAAEAVWAGVTIPAGAYTVAVADLTPPAIATTSGSAITIDPDAAGRLWHTDTATAPADANAGVDLVTVLAHEIGHVLGFADLAPPNSGPSDLMVGSIQPGERRATIGAHTWTEPVNGAASVTLASGTLTVGTATMSAAYVSDIVVTGGAGNDVLTPTDVDVPIMFAAGDVGTDGVVGPDADTAFTLTAAGAGTFTVGSATPTTVTFSGVESLAAGTGSETVAVPAGTHVDFTGVGVATVTDTFNALVANITGVDQFDSSAGAVTYSTGADATIGALTMDADDLLLVETNARTATQADPATADTDTLTVTNAATLAGTLEVRQATGAPAGVTTASPYLSANTVTGSFGTFVGLDLGGGSYVALTHVDGPPVMRSLQAVALPRAITIGFDDATVANYVLALAAGEVSTPPAAPTAIELTVNGQSIKGSATFSKPAGTLLQVVLSDVVVRLGDAANPLVTVDGSASATLTLTPDTNPDPHTDTSNLSGTLTGTITTTVDELGIAGTVTVAVNAQQTSAITATATGLDFTVGGERVDIGATDSITFERVASGGDAQVRITGLADQTITLGT